LRDAGRIGVQVPGHPPHRRRHVLLADRLGDRAVGPGAPYASLAVAA
jgi:hypothetical protein